MVTGTRLFVRLPFFLLRPLHPGEAQQMLRRRLERREDDFLTLVRRTVYEHARSPYRQLLMLAGCEYGDLEKLVKQVGVEEALKVLYRHGVYLAVDEFKGRRPVVRGGSTIPLDPKQLRNPHVSAHLFSGSSGSRGRSIPAPIDLASVRDHAVNKGLCLQVWDALGCEHAHWAVPGGAVMFQMLQLAALGLSPARWFSQLDPRRPDLHFRYRWAARTLRWGSALAGISMPSPSYVPLDSPLPVARWMAQVLRVGRTPHLHTYTSSAVRVSQAAFDNGIDLRGAKFSVGSEPITTTRLSAIRCTGADVEPTYGSSETGMIAWGCFAPNTPDEHHLFHDLLALTQPGADGESANMPPDTLLISSLRSTARFILLNVSLGDRAEVFKRACGCGLERLGWTTHLRTIRSFEKLTAGGMMFLDADVIRVLEDLLPERFGGGPTDYQLVEEEAEGGQPRVRLLIHPAVGSLDMTAVREMFLAAIGGGSGADRVMELQLRAAGLFTVERRPPLMNGLGKIQHIHYNQREARPASTNRV